MANAFTRTFLSSNLKRCLSLIKALSWFEADLQILLIFCVKSSLSSIYIPKRLTFDIDLISL